MYRIGFKHILVFFISVLYFEHVSARNLMNERTVIEDSFKDLLSNDYPVRGTIDLHEVDEHATICWNEKTTLHFYTNGTHHGYVEYSISLELSPEEFVHPADDVPKETYEVFNVELQGSQVLDFVIVQSNSHETVKENKTVICKSGKAFWKIFKGLKDRKKVEVIIKKDANSVTWKEVAGDGELDSDGLADRQLSAHSGGFEQKQESKDSEAIEQNQQSDDSGATEQGQESEGSGTVEQGQQSKDSGTIEQRQFDSIDQDETTDKAGEPSANSGLSDTLSTRIAFSEDDIVAGFKGDVTQVPEMKFQDSVNQDDTSNSHAVSGGEEGELEPDYTLRTLSIQSKEDSNQERTPEALSHNESSGPNTALNNIQDADNAEVVDIGSGVSDENPVSEHSEEPSFAEFDNSMEAKNLGNAEGADDDECSKTRKVKIKLSLDMEDEDGKSNEVAHDIEFDLNQPFQNQGLSARSNNELLNSLLAHYYNKALAKHKSCLNKKNKNPQTQTAFRLFAGPQQDSGHYNSYANDPNLYANDPNIYANMYPNQPFQVNDPNLYANMYPTDQYFQLVDPNLYANVYPTGQQFQLNNPNLYPNGPSFYQQVPGVYDPMSLYMGANSVYMSPRSLKESPSNETSWTDTLKNMFSFGNIKSKYFT